MKFISENKSSFSIEITPLIDIVFLLVIFFVVTSKVGDSQFLSLELPKTESFEYKTVQNSNEIVIINNGSISAHVPRPGSAPYTATKHAVTGLTRSTSLDGRKYNIACGQIDIGNALTEMAARMTKGVPQADGSIQVEPVMDVANVGKTVAHMASLPMEANVQFVTVMATNMPFIGRG